MFMLFDWVLSLHVEMVLSFIPLIENPKWDQCTGFFSQDTTAKNLLRSANRVFSYESSKTIYLPSVENRKFLEVNKHAYLMPEYPYQGRKPKEDLPLWPLSSWTSSLALGLGVSDQEVSCKPVLTG